MNKIIFTSEEINDIINMYVDNLLSSKTISLKYNVDGGVIRNLLKSNNVQLRHAGRLDLGGRKIADKKWRDNNKPYTSKKHKSWASKNKKHLKDYMKNYREENIDNIRKTKRDYERNRKSKDPVYKLIGNFRTAIYTVLKENNMTKFGHYFEVLGYTPNDLVKHLESQFKDGITWQNYGEWHVDHKLPLSSFTFTDMNDPEFKRCWSLENLQPMWGDENIKKYNHIL